MVSKGLGAGLATIALAGVGAGIVIEVLILCGIHLGIKNVLDPQEWNATLAALLGVVHRMLYVMLLILLILVVMAAVHPGVDGILLGATFFAPLYAVPDSVLAWIWGANSPGPRRSRHQRLSLHGFGASHFSAASHKKHGISTPILCTPGNRPPNSQVLSSRLFWPLLSLARGCLASFAYLLAGIVKVLAFSAEPTIFTDCVTLGV